MKLVIVESPTKAKTISQFLGKGYQVESSYGHIRDLPKSKLGIDVLNGFLPQYVVPRKARQTVTALRKAAAESSAVILATDEDREGEAIAWHLAQALDLEKSKIKNQKSKTERIVFHEITKPAIEHALAHPRQIDINLVNAQQARRILDRLVGYQLSPFLWKKVVRGLSAGRVQSVALRLVVEREEEIKNFQPEEYWTIAALLETTKGEPQAVEALEAFLYRIGGEVVPKLGIKTETEAKKIVSDLKRSEFRVARIERKETKKNPLPPFITSTLQQTAATRLGFTAKKTMFLAQKLYENGHITYMRTDSVTLSREALSQAADWIKRNLPPEYHLREPRTFKSASRLAQEAHEAIRPTDIGVSPEALSMDKGHQKLYDLIRRRFLASQLPQAIFDATKVEIEAKSSKTPAHYTLAANGSILRFDGFLKIWPAQFEEKTLPALTEGEPLALKEARQERHETEPLPRYNEASLVKTLERYGIGRPSTYAPIISIIQDRNYVEKREGRFYPTEIGTVVNRVLTEHFPEVVDAQFTARMEEELDEIAQGKERWQTVIKEFHEPFARHLAEKYETVEKTNMDEATDEVCEKCGRPMVIKFGRFGKFLACSGFPECKNAKPLVKDAPKSTGVKCSKCGEGELMERRVMKRGRARGKIFWGCSRYPECDYATWTNPLQEQRDANLTQTNADK